MTTGRITKRAVEAIAVPQPGKRHHLWDDTVKGFGVMVTHTGVRSYVLQYRMGGRGFQTKTFTLGRHGSPWTAEKARERAIDLLEQVRKGIDPKAAQAESREREAKASVEQDKFAFSTYADMFIQRHAVKKKLRSTPDIEAVFRRDLKPRFGDRDMRELSRSDITTALDEIGDRSGSAANKAHKWLKKMFNFAAKRGDIHLSPMDRMGPPHEQQSRDRSLSDEEISALVSVCRDLGYPFGRFAQLLLLTGQRLREVAGMRWTEVDWEAREWLIPGARTKNGNAHIMPLSQAAIDILAEIRSKELPGDFVFSTTTKSPISGFSKAKARIDLMLRTRAANLVIPPWTFHDLRRTVATGCQRLGVPIDHTEALLNHTGRRRGLVSVYQLYDYRREKAEAIDQWGKQVEALTNV